MAENHLGTSALKCEAYTPMVLTTGQPWLVNGQASQLLRKLVSNIYVCIIKEKERKGKKDNKGVS